MQSSVEVGSASALAFRAKKGLTAERGVNDVVQGALIKNDIDASPRGH